MYGMGGLLEKAARFYPARCAIADKEGCRPYRELNERVDGICAAFAAAGLKKGDRLGIVCDNRNEFAEVWLATQKCGVVAVLLNYQVSPDEMIRDLNRSGCVGAFAPGPWARALSSKLPASITLFSFHCADAPAVVDLGRSCAVPAPPPQTVIRETDWSTILFTSGSTGLSKGVVRTHRMVFEYAMQLAAEHEFYKTDPVRILSHSPLFHTGGLSMLMKALALGGTYITVRGFDPDEVCSLIERYRATQLFLVPPSNIMRLYRMAEKRACYDLSSVNFVWATGGKLSLSYVLAMLDFFPGARIKTSYGGTEFCAACSVSYALTPQQARADPQLFESAGYVGQFVDMRLVDEKGRDVAPGEPGEVWVSSPFVMLGYLDEPERTGEVLSGDWYRTGDIFRQDDRGLLYFVDRKSAMIKTGGENVYPLEVESVMRRHPAVIDCAVCAHPDPEWDESVAVALLLEEGADLAEVCRFARDNLVGFRRPRYYLVLDELPKTASGKVDRRAFRDAGRFAFKSVKEIIG